MPKQQHLRKILVLGSGPIVIGQAAEFDYAGTQACLALKEEGCEVVLLNNNPATVMTDEQCADRVYFEPLTVEVLTKIIEKERPDGLLASVGGQTGLNLALAAYNEGIFEQYNVQLLGTSMQSIQQGEDRELFRALMHDINEPVPESEIVSTVDEAVQFANVVGFPIIVRPAYTLGGAGGGHAYSKEQLKEIVAGGLAASPITQCLIEQSIAGFKEIEYEVMRDDNDTCITICNMENIDPVGVHTGDSIVVAPSQTLSDHDYQMLRSASIKVIRALGIVGGCNIQFALDPSSNQYYLIEVNPRVSRSSALASKATGYPIARIAAKLGVGYHLHELKNPVTAHTYASFEPALDYVIVKFPRWPFDKFKDGNRELGTQMKATGEVMAIERNLQAGLQKAVRSLEIPVDGLKVASIEAIATDELIQRIEIADDQRFFTLLELLRRNVTIDTLHEQTGIDHFYLQHFKRLIELEQSAESLEFEGVDRDTLYELKKSGFTDVALAKALNTTEQNITQLRERYDLYPSYQQVDTCAGEFMAETPYYYSTWGTKGDHHLTGKPSVLIVGSGPIRIGQGIEFDYCSVSAAHSLKRMGYETIMINNNPETVSTDYETADKLYFEPLTAEDVIHVAKRENVQGVLLQLGGQTGVKLTEALEKAGIPLYGATFDVIDQLEDRGRFYELMQTLDIPHIPGTTGMNAADTEMKASEIGYPVLLRPSYVIGGEGMAIFTSEAELKAYLNDSLNEVAYPILIDRYVAGKELEVDVVTDGEQCFIPGIFEHVEKAGVHSGDSMAVTPPYSIPDPLKETIVSYTTKIAKHVSFVGLFNIQFVYENNTLYVIEINPRASRTVPIFAKITNIDLVDCAVQLLLGKPFEACVPSVGLLEEPSFYSVKAPVFSTEKLPDVDMLLSAEMKSTGETLSFGSTVEEAFQQAFAWKDDQTPKIYTEKSGSIFVDAGDAQQSLIRTDLEKLEQSGFTIVQGSSEQFNEWITTEDARLYVSIPDLGSKHYKDQREKAKRNRIQLTTHSETLHALVQGIDFKERHSLSLDEWQKKDLQRT